MFWLLLSALLLLSACSAPVENSAAEVEPAANLEWHSCQLSHLGATLPRAARCTQILVPEDPANPSGRQIELNVAVIPAVSRNPAPDAVFFIPGGPGEAATESFISVSSAFEAIGQKRDIVLVDQRGTGGSHPLECKVSPEESTDEVSIETYVQSCLDALDADPRFYTTSVAVQDLDQVRANLGYPQINLYGGSYGTRAALEYMRRFPERVRTAVLDGVAPPEWSLGPDAPVDAQAALDALFARCAGQPECRLAFPEIASEFDALLDKFSTGPVTVSIDHPETGEPTTFEFSRSEFVNTVHLLSYTPETAALLPLLIHTAYTRDDLGRIAAITQTNTASLLESLSLGMRYSVMCAEDVPFYPAQPAGDGYLGPDLTDSFRTICDVWPRGELPAGYKDPVRSEAPTLLISGENDPATPPENAALAAVTLPNSLNLVAPGMGHINVFRGCLPRLMADLIDIGSIDGLDATCVEAIEPPPFFINFNGPTP